MTRALRDVDWDDVTEYTPAVIVAIAMPFAFSIASGIGLGFITYTVVKTAAGRAREVPGAVWIIAALFALKMALA
jgi:AGZA family xanthine/uracil permease-like MFS transporter